VGFDHIDWFDPDIVRLATYCANAGSTWRDKDTGKLITKINGKFIPIVRDLFMQFFPSTVYTVGGSQVEVKPGVGVWKHHLVIKDSELLEQFEEKGYFLGSRRRRPNPEIINSPHLFPDYLRVIWEIHGKILSRDPLVVAIEEKYPQELSKLKELLLKVDVYTEMRRSNFFYLEMSDRKSIINFFDLFNWKADWKYGKKNIEQIKFLLDQQEIKGNVGAQAS